MEDVQAVRSLFILDPEIRYLNHGSFGATPRTVLAAQRQHQDELERQPMRFMAGLAPRLRRVMERIAPRLGARAEDVVFVDNASTGVSAVLRSFPFAPGDSLITTSHAYPAVRRAVDYVAARHGLRVRIADVPWPLPSLDAVVDAVEAAWAPDVRLAVLDRVSSASATRMPVEVLVPWLQARGARVLIDAAHGPGLIPLDLDRIGADYTTGNLHKWWFAPKGCAFLHARPDARQHLAPLVVSNRFGDGFAESFELQGTRDPSAWLAADAALDVVDALGGDAAIQDRNMAVARLAAGRVGERLRAPPLTPSDAWTAMVPLGVRGVPAEIPAVLDLVDRVRDRHGIQTWMMPLLGRVVLRVCVQVYNTADDFDALADALAAEGVGAP